jgi:hypothetical protein
MSVSNDVFRRISPQLRTFRIALTVSDDECVLMDDLHVRKGADGTLECRTERHDDMREGDGLLRDTDRRDWHDRWNQFSPVVDASWIQSRVSIRANRLWATMLTDEERLAIRAERPVGQELDPTAGVGLFIKRLMRRLLGYHQSPDKAAALCSLAVARMLDPRLTLAIRQICGWKAEGSDQVIRAWDRVDATGRQIGLSGRPVQVSCLALILARHIQREGDVVGILDADPRTAQRRFEEFEAYVVNPNVDEYMPSVASTQVHDLCEVADLLPAALRSAGVKPAFWRMALRMSPAQIRALKFLLSKQWSPETTELLNALSAIDESLLRPTLLRTLSQRWIDSGWGPSQRTIVLAVLHRAAVGIAARRSRQPLRDAVHQLEQVVDHLSHLALEKAREDREALGLQWDEPTKFDLDDLGGPFSHWQPETEATLRRKSDDSIAALRRVLPKTRDWKQLVAASDVWHAESILAMDESDSRTWPRLLADPVAIGDVTITELDSAALLRQETRELNHCVGTGGYASMCMNGTTRILSLRLKGLRSRSTMQLALTDGAWRNVQHRGRSNSVPKPALLAAEKAALKAVNDAHKRAAKTVANDDTAIAQAA